ncbi:N-acetyllactosaminide beta-1,3-N-acetylglucosaminyltransferase 2-like [Amblyraja radiata]|uniref:N-acetyllactosaminide beta-1,3-N-acetylglucosaminyltransferase 2-like n=1 Tax=Amblyraja radiata TaxID=386614 RepID=UPI001403627C|nr:N-acetyllactosaminide beta-1,3-N-acetylglucosaminyltransferase 2-like [Amblyraja radiata]
MGLPAYARWQGLGLLPTRTSNPQTPNSPPLPPLHSSSSVPPPCVTGDPPPPKTRMRRKLWRCAASGLLVAAAMGLWILQQPRPQALLRASAFWRAPCPLQSLWNRELALMHGQRLRRRGLARSTGSGPRCRPDTTVETSVVDFQLLPPLMQDFLRYRRCRSFPVVLEPRGVCGPGPGPSPRLLLAVKSQVSNFARRQAIRQSWGGLGRSAGVGLVFLLGQQEEVDGHPRLQGLLDCERRSHGDLLQWGFRDTFLNLTLKEVLFLPWLARRCPSARFIFKGDDDIFVNTEGLLGFLTLLEQVHDLFLGDTIEDGRPCRDAEIKYYVPGAFYSGLYPAYAGGAGVLYTAHLARRLERASRSLPLFPIDDVFVGMCLRSLGLAPTPHPDFYSFGINDSQHWDPCAYHRLLMVHPRSPHENLLIWGMLHSGDLCCD